MLKMKKLLLLLFSLMVSFNSYAGWKKVGEDALSDYYFDKSLIKERDGYVYWWVLLDGLKPSPDGYLSYKIYKQGNCRTNQFLTLKAVWYKDSMARGSGDTVIRKYTWTTPAFLFDDLKTVCKYIK